MSETDNQTALPAGMRIEHYELIKTLGRGGFGITYLALDKHQNRPVVLKEYFPEAAAMRTSQQTHISLLSASKEHDFTEGLRRFKREAMLLSEFRHPNIVKVLALFEANNTAYFVMEYVDGQSLQDLLEQGNNTPLSEADIQQQLLPVLNGIAAIHAKDILHLDIKPDNILTSTWGEPLLIDFGGARYATSQASQDHSSMVATLGYAPPEQYTLGKEQTPATDLYAFGMTLYHLMAPQQELPDARGRQDALVEETPDPLPNIRDISSGYSDALYQVVEYCTQVRRNRRPQTVAEVQALLPEPQDVPITDIDRTPSPAPEPSTPTPEPEQSQSEPVSQPTPDPIPAPINNGHSEAEKKKSPLLAIIAAVVLLVCGGFGYQQYQIQQEQQRIEQERLEAERQAQQEAERQAAEAAAEAERQRQAELARQEAERREKEEAERQAKAEAERKEQERLAQLEAERKAKEAAARKAEQERQAKAARERKFRDGYTVTAGGVRFRMRGIPSGSFNMGSNNGRSNEKPVHRVSISSFYMMEHEVTFALWDACVSDGKCERPSDKGWGRGSRPVINVSWNDITKKFIPWLNRKTGKTFRLPSESEWEYAARAGSTTKYSWGDSIDCSKADYNYIGCNSTGTSTVKSYQPNAFGLYDMHGNAWEQVQDCWNGNYNGAPSNNRAWDLGNCDRRVLRGGSWLNGPTNLRSANRDRNYTSFRYFNGGFRLVQAP